MAKLMVMSKAIRAVEYDAERQHFDVELTNGRGYRYVDVPPETYAAFLAAKSKGKYYNDHIRDVYIYVRLSRLT